MTTHYHGSKGPVEIAKMAEPHLRSAHAKLIRDGFEKERAAEVQAMAARLAEIDAMADEEPAPFVSRAEIAF